MLREMSPIRQVASEPRRRWFASPGCDLIVWLDEGEAVAAFQFCYDKADREHALTWMPSAGFSHARVDSGESFGGVGKGTPFLVASEHFDPTRILAAFRAEGGDLPPEYIELITAKLAELALTGRAA